MGEQNGDSNWDRRPWWKVNITAEGVISSETHINIVDQSDAGVEARDNHDSGLARTHTPLQLARLYLEDPDKLWVGPIPILSLTLFHIHCNN